MSFWNSLFGKSVPTPTPRPTPPVSQGRPRNVATQTRTTEAGIAMIHEFEGFRDKAYPDPGSRDGHPWTVGFGSTSYHHPEIKKGFVVDRATADRWFREELVKTEQAVAAMVKVQLTPNQFSALVSFAYNVGIGALQKSTLLRLLNKGEYGAAADQFLRWSKNDGKEMAGLLRRRKAERALFLKP